MDKLPHKGRNLLFQRDPQWRRRNGRTGDSPARMDAPGGPALAGPCALGVSGGRRLPRDRRIHRRSEGRARADLGPGNARRRRGAAQLRRSSAARGRGRAVRTPSSQAGERFRCSGAAGSRGTRRRPAQRDRQRSCRWPTTSATSRPEADSLCAVLDVDPAARDAVVLAARWHDLGKAHEVFQDTMRRGLDGRGRGAQHAARQDRTADLATAGPTSATSSPPTLAFLAHEGWSRDADLVAYLIAAHHGKGAAQPARPASRGGAEGRPRPGRASPAASGKATRCPPSCWRAASDGKAATCCCRSWSWAGTTSPARAGRSARASCSPASDRSGWLGWRRCCGWPTGGHPRRSATEAGMRGEPLALRGCAPTPLASYLKALGVLRLVSSPANHVSGAAADPHARGWWENECFHLRTDARAATPCCASSSTTTRRARSSRRGMDGPAFSRAMRVRRRAAAAPCSCVPSRTASADDWS